MKRLISCIAALALLLAAVCFVASADGKTAYEKVLEGVLNCEEEIDLQSYGLEASEFHEIYSDLMHNEPMLFHATGSYSYGVEYGSDKVRYILPEYSMSKSEYNSAREFVDSEIERILSLVPQGLNEVETALFLHDYLATNLEYDLDLKIYDIYNALKNGKCVCMGYALLYDELLTRIGIENYAVNSPYESINHMWNEIKVDGKWYHVDVTWDDPIADRFGRVDHTNFLTCDSCTKTNHDDCIYYTKNQCNSTTYETVGWRKIYSSFAFVGDKIYALDYYDIVEFTLDSSEVTQVQRVHDKYWYTPDGELLGYYGGFGGYGNKLYYNTDKAIMSYDVYTKQIETVYTVSEGLIIGLYLNGNEINYLLSPTGYYDDGVKRIYTIEEGSGDESSKEESSKEESSEYVPDESSKEESSEYVPDESKPDESKPDESKPDESKPDESQPDESKPDESQPDESQPDESEPEESEPEKAVGGDANGDGKLDQYDYIQVKRVYFGTLTVNSTERARADVNSDGEVNQYDYILVKRANFGTYVFE